MVPRGAGDALSESRWGGAGGAGDGWYVYCMCGMSVVCVCCMCLLYVWYVYCMCLLYVSIVCVVSMCLLYVSIVSVYCMCVLYVSIVCVVSLLRARADALVMILHRLCHGESESQTLSRWGSAGRVGLRVACL